MVPEEYPARITRREEAAPLRHVELAGPRDQEIMTGRSITPPPRPRHVQLQQLLPGHLRSRRADCGLYFLLFLRRRQHRGHAERLNPPLAAPAGRVVEVLVLLLLNPLIGRLERFALFALGLLCD